VQITFRANGEILATSEAYYYVPSNGLEVCLVLFLMSFGSLVGSLTPIGLLVLLSPIMPPFLSLIIIE